MNFTRLFGPLGIHGTSNATIHESGDIQNSVHYLFGAMMTLSSCIGTILNIIVGSIAYSHRTSINSASVILPVLAIIGLIMSCIIIPFNIISAFSSYYSFDSTGCQLYSFTIAFLGYMFIVCLVVTVIQSYRIIVRRDLQNKGFDCCSTGIIITGSVAVSVLFAAIPLFGITGYVKERRPVLCQMRWKPKSTLDILYTSSLMLMFYVVPAAVISILYYAIYRKVKITSVKRRGRRSINILKTFIIIAVSFLICWTPYVVYCFLEITNSSYSEKPIWMQILASIVAKLSIAWLPTLFLLRHREYKQKFKTIIYKVVYRHRQAKMKILANPRGSLIVLDSEDIKRPEAIL